MKTITYLVYFILLQTIIKFIRADQYTFADFYMANTLEIVNYQSTFLDTNRRSNVINEPLPNQFSNPQVLICIHQADIDTRPNWVAFQVSNQVNLSQKQVVFTAQQFNDSAINNLRISYLIIQHESVFITQESYQILNNNQLQISVLKQYKKPTSSPPKIYIYLTGYQSQLQGNVNKIYLSISQSSQGFNIIINRSDINISQVYYNYIEIYNDSFIQIPPFNSGPNISPYYGLNVGMDFSQQDSTQSELYENVDTYNFPNGRDRYSIYNNVSIDISVPGGSSFSYTQLGIIIGFIGLEFDISNRGQGIRMIIQDLQITLNKLSFRYRTWNIARMRGVVSQYLYINMIQCSQYPSTPINDSINFKCINSCNLTGQYQATDSLRSIQNCSNCDQSCLTCVGPSNNQCLSCPSGKYLALPGSTCQSCNNTCSQCNNQTSCTDCSSSYPFYYNFQCFIQQPANTYCDSKTFICQQCPSDCNGCTIDMKCILCKNQTDYFLNGQCSPTQPPNSYCKQYQCTQCPVECNQCYQNLQCLACSDQTQYFYQGSCTQKQPSSTYCERNNQLNISSFCKICHPTCKSCTGPLQSQCSSCNDEYRLNNNSTCICQVQGQAFNPQTQSCNQCKISGCISCNYDINKCDQCEKNLKLDQTTSECYCENQDQYFDKKNLKICLKNIIQHCVKSDRFLNLCLQCEAGYLNVNQQICSYCGKGLFTDANNQCVNKCQSNCFICTNDKTCLVTQDETQNGKNNLDIDYNNFQCHLSCSICNGITDNNCLQCSSSTRAYSLQNSTCACKNGYFETEKADCFKYQDLDSSFLSIENSLFVIFLVLQMPFIFFNKKKFIIQNFNATQMIALLSFDSQLQKNLNFVKMLQQFLKLSFINIFNINFTKNEDLEIQHELNALILLTSFQTISLVIIITGFLIKNNQFQNTTFQILQFTHNLTSTFSIAIISNLFNNLGLLQQSQMIILIISSCIQLIILLYQTKILLEKSNLIAKSDSSTLNDLESSLNKSSNLKIENTNMNLLNESSEKRKHQICLIYKVLLAFQLKAIMISIILSLLERSQISLIISGGVELFFLLLILISFPFKKRLNNIVCMVVQLSVSACFLFQSFLKNQIVVNMDQDNFNKISSLYLMQSFLLIIFFLQIVISISTFLSIVIILYNKFNSLSKNKNITSNQTNQAIPQLINKRNQTNFTYFILFKIFIKLDMINSILSNKFNSRNPYSIKRKQAFWSKRMSYN